jgi:hypothetical protein
MAGHASSELVRYDPTVNGHEPELDEPIPGWRTPIALAGWGTLIAILIALIVWGIIQLARGAPPQEPAPILITTPPTSTLSSVAPVVPPTPQQTYQETAPTITTEIPTSSSANPDTPTMSTTPSPGSFPLPQLPSVITLPALPGLPTEITLPPGL